MPRGPALRGASLIGRSVTTAPRQACGGVWYSGPVMDGIMLSSEVVALIGVGAVLLVAIVAEHIALVRLMGQFPRREEMRAEIRAAEERLRQDAQEREERWRQETALLRQEAQEREERQRQDTQEREERWRQEIALLRQEAQEREERLRQEAQEREERQTQQIRSLEEAMRENTARIIDAIASHRHPQPDGEPVFTRPA